MLLNSLSSIQSATRPRLEVYKDWIYSSTRGWPTQKLTFSMQQATKSAISYAIWRNTRPKRILREKLCHTELVDYQVHIDCTGRLQEHHEWFQTSPENAIAVIRKWSAWMNSGPYDPALRSLKEREKGRLSIMANFMIEIAKVAMWRGL